MEMRTASRVIFVGVALCGLAFGTSTTASANAAGWPTGCTYQVADSWRTVARCSDAHGGHYRAVARCKDSEDGSITEAVGDWRASGWSKAYCPGSTKPTTAGIDTKST